MGWRIAECKGFLKRIEMQHDITTYTTLHLSYFISLCKAIPENTASPVSGLHYGHL